VGASVSVIDLLVGEGSTARTEVAGASEGLEQLEQNRIRIIVGTMDLCGELVKGDFFLFFHIREDDQMIPWTPEKPSTITE
jgi:hypothetical protein